MIIKTKLNCKICIMNGSRAKTRIKPYFKKANDFRIITNTIMSIRGLFDDKNIIKRFSNSNVRFILDESIDKNDKLIAYLKKTYPNFQFKLMKNVKLNIFISTTDGVDFDVYPFGYRTPNLLSPTGLAFKFKNKELAEYYRNWFDNSWNQGELLHIERLEFLNNNECATVTYNTDDGGYNFEYVKAIISDESTISKNCNRIVDFKTIINNDDYYPINSSCSIIEYEDCVMISYEISNNHYLNIKLFDNIVVEKIKNKFLEKYSNIKRVNINYDINDFLKMKEIGGILFYYLLHFYNRENEMKMIKEHYFKVKGPDAKRKYDICLKNVEDYLFNDYSETESPNDKYIDSRMFKK